VADQEQPAFMRTPVGRRLFLGLMGAGAVAFAAGARLIDQPVKYHNVSTMPFNGDEQSYIITNPVFKGPDRFRYYSVAPVPSFNRATWKLSVGGLVDKPMTIDYASLFAMPSVVVRAPFRCVTGWAVHDCAWQGVQLKRILDLARAQPGARFVTFLSFDGLYRESFTLEQATVDHAIVGYKLNGRSLAQYEGAPARVIQPDMFGYKNLKWLGEIRLTAKREQGYWEQKGWCNPIVGDGTIDDCS
jgi:DMSO/TMAO reductase YedYZ molybdopterin-dependent catalytic subunit